MTNNDILKKLRIALSLKDTDIIEILKMVDFEISKGALGDLFRSEDHPNYVEAGDQVLRNFLNGLILYKRGPANPPLTAKKTDGPIKKNESSKPIKSELRPHSNQDASNDKKNLFYKNHFTKKR